MRVREREGESAERRERKIDGQSTGSETGREGVGETGGGRIERKGAWEQRRERGEGRREGKTGMERRMEGRRKGAMKEGRR